MLCFVLLIWLKSNCRGDGGDIGDPSDPDDLSDPNDLGDLSIRGDADDLSAIA